MEFARTNPGKVIFGSVGVGSSPHLDTLKLIRLTGVQMVHVPFKGGAAPILTSLGGGEIHWSFMNLSLAHSFSKAGRVKVLAVAMANRAPELPDVPTMAESGFPGVGSPQWQAVFAPAATSKATIARLHAAIQEIIQRADMKDFFARNFLTIIPNKTPQVAAAYVNADSERWAEIVRENNIRADTLAIEKDVRIQMRDGAILYADVYRPQEDGKFPAIVNISAYQKDKVWVPPADLEEKANPYMTWETVNPLWWVPRGYACVRVDTRGSGKSPGLSDPGGWQETLDFYDAIEWAAKQSWCSGNIGTAGISYHATTQWRVAGLQPPSLKAIIPWEGWGDCYRDAAYHGGIFQLYYLATWYATQMAHHLLGDPQEYNPDAFHNERLFQYMRHSLDTGWWDNRSAHWDKIKVPFLSAGNWSGHNLHLRGNTEGYVRAASKHKKLRIHTGTHYHAFYTEEGRMDQLRWFDYWLKGHRHRHHGRAAGEAADPHRRRHHEGLQVPLRERMAARAHAVDPVLSQG